MKNEPPDGLWSHPPARAAMLDEVRALSPGDRAGRLSIGLGKHGYVDDEVVVTLLLAAWRAGEDNDADTYAGALTKRVLKQVRAHARKNPAWQLLGGGSTVIDDLCQSIVVAILQDKARPCHGEQAFGNYVYRRCLDEASHSMTKSQSRPTHRTVSLLTCPRWVAHRRSCWRRSKSSSSSWFSLSRSDGSLKTSFQRWTRLPSRSASTAG